MAARIVLCFGIIMQIALTVQDDAIDIADTVDTEFNITTPAMFGYNFDNNNLTSKSNIMQKSLRCSSEQWEPYMKLALVPVISVVGIVGNTLAFVVLRTPVFSRKTYSRYLQCLAVFDTLTLLLITLRECDEICRALGNYDTCIYPWLLRNTVSCQIWDLFQHVVYLMSSWLVVCFTIDRCAAVCQPLFHRSLTKSRSRLIIFALVVLASLTQLFRLWFVEHLENRSQPCHVPLERVNSDLGLSITNESKHRRLTYMMIDTFAFEFGFRFLVPCVIIAFCNGYIIFHIMRVRRALPIREQRRSRYTNMAITTLFCVCILFVICLLPNSLLNIIMHIYFTILQKVGFHDVYCSLLFMDGPFKMIRMLNYALNFMLYGLTGRQFRREFFRVLRGRNRLHFEGNLLFYFTNLT